MPAGCEECDHTGYKGRMGIYEIVPFDDAVREAVRDGTKIDEVRNYARGAGMRSMQEDALDKIVQGITSADEVLRVVPVEMRRAAQCPVCRGRIIGSFKFCPHCGAPRQDMKGQPEVSASHSEVEVTRS